MRFLVKLFLRLAFVAWIVAFFFLALDKGIGAAALVLLGLPFVAVFTVLSLTWPLLVAMFAIWGTYRIVKTIRTAEEN